MKSHYISEGRIEEIEIPKGGLLPGDFKIERHSFSFKGEPKQDGIYVLKGSERLAVVFFNYTIGEPCVMQFTSKVCLRLQSLAIIANVIEHWDRLMKDLPMNMGIVITIQASEVKP